MKRACGCPTPMKTLTLPTSPSHMGISIFHQYWHTFQHTEIIGVFRHLASLG